MKWRLLVWAAVLAGCAADVAPGEEEPLSRPEPSRGDIGREALNQTAATKPYAGAAIGPWALNTGCDPTFDPGGPSNVGGACFVLPPGTQEVEFEVVDDITDAVGVYVRFDQGSTGFFCTRGVVAPPAGATWIMIVMSDVACVLQNQVAAPTTGEIKLTMYHL